MTLITFITIGTLSVVGIALRFLNRNAHKETSPVSIN